MKSSTQVKRTRNRLPTIWKNGGRGKMRTIQVPLGIKEEAYQIALVLNHESDTDMRLERIRQILKG
ncbi:hypothetical protein THII_2227 [Thioploca ingrica]|uniref:Uncharacterized protein n=1 Tax=Thioploca ingrica TaxID=40754 RepID=A0A090AH28_9GAMM|nr:hypothetical protein THII_2227 [Thioploca ingrica]